MVTDRPAVPDVQVLGDHVLLGGAALYRLAVLAADGLRARAANGTRDPQSAHDLVRQLGRAAAGVERAAKDALAAQLVDHDTRSADDSLMTTAEVADALGIGARQVARLADRLGARKVSRAPNAPLLYDRDLVVAEQIRRAG